MSNDIKERINYLVEILNKANVAYYVNDNPSITDSEYDSLLRQLESLEEKYPEYKRIDGFILWTLTVLK